MAPRSNYDVVRDTLDSAIELAAKDKIGPAIVLLAKGLQTLSRAIEQDMAEVVVDVESIRKKVP